MLVLPTFDEGHKMHAKVVEHCVRGIQKARERHQKVIPWYWKHVDLALLELIASAIALVWLSSLCLSS